MNENLTKKRDLYQKGIYILLIPSIISFILLLIAYFFFGIKTFIEIEGGSLEIYMIILGGFIAASSLGFWYLVWQKEELNNKINNINRSKVFKNRLYGNLLLISLAIIFVILEQLGWFNNILAFILFWVVILFLIYLTSKLLHHKKS